TGTSVTVQGTAPAVGQYSFDVTVTDLSTGATAYLRCSFTVSVALQITGSCPTSSVLVGTAFSIPLAVTGGSGMYSWTVMGAFSASAMSGSSINISGTPTTPGSFPISATVTDNSGSLPATFQCSLLVVAPVAIAGPPCPIPNVIQGQTFSLPFSATGGSGSYAWSFSGPTFASLSQASGSSTALAGTAPGLGIFPFSVTVTDTLNAALTAVYTCSLQVAAPITLLTQTLPNAVVGQQYPATKLSVSGGSPPLTFKVTAGNLPPGLQLDSGSGSISGTATQTGTYSFTVTVTDSANGSSSQGFNILAVAPLMNTTACPLPAGRELESYNAPLTATGGTGQYVFSISGSTLLPPGLVLNQNAITGTPEGPSSTALSIQVSSGSQTTQPVSCQLTIMGRQPVVTVNGFFVTTSSNLLTSSVSLDVPVQQDVTGTATLSFTPNVPNTAITDNPQVQFCGGNTGDPLCSSAQENSAGLLRILSFTIPAGTQSVDLSPALESNVAGTIEIALSNLTMGGQSLSAAPLEFTIPQTVPAILSSPQAGLSGNTLQITATVSSSTCELTSATAVFHPSQGSQLAGAGGGSLTSVVDLTSLFTNFTPFAVSSTHPTGGCAFTLTLPFTITGSPAAIASVDLILNNTVGAAPTATIGLQQ
ncbi:MAG: putative Ig domain-containing protein, partial [Bryobacteraceae bacterium]